MTLYDRRIQRLRSTIQEPLLVSFLPNIRYLTGFTGSNAFALIGADEVTFVTDGRYGEVAAGLVAAIDGADLVIYQSGLTEVLAGQMSGHGTVALESSHVSWAFLRDLRSAYGGDLVPSVGLVEGLREIKDADEVASLRAAAAAGDAAFARITDLADRAVTEDDLGWDLIGAMRAAGGSQADWPPIVAVGANAALPHHRSGSAEVGAGLLLLDYGCVVDDYHSDMSRTIWLGPDPDSEVERMYQAVLESQAAGIDAVRPGVTGHDVDEACRVVLREHGYEDRFVHSTGHGVGLEIHEAPRLARESAAVLEPGHVVTVEPGVYVPGLGGVRIEDMVVVTESGNEVLTYSNKELLPK